MGGVAALQWLFLFFLYSWLIPISIVFEVSFIFWLYYHPPFPPEPILHCAIRTSDAFRSGVDICGGFHLCISTMNVHAFQLGQQRELMMAPHDTPLHVGGLRTWTQSLCSLQRRRTRNVEAKLSGSMAFSVIGWLSDELQGRVVAGLIIFPLRFSISCLPSLLLCLSSSSLSATLGIRPIKKLSLDPFAEGAVPNGNDVLKKLIKKKNMQCCYQTIWAFTTPALYPRASPPPRLASTMRESCASATVTVPPPPVVQRMTPSISVGSGRGRLNRDFTRISAIFWRWLLLLLLALALLLNDDCIRALKGWGVALAGRGRLSSSSSR